MFRIKCMLPLLLILFATNLLFAEQDCILETPINLGNIDLLKGNGYVTSLAKVEFREVPKFYDPEFNPEEDLLAIYLFNIDLNNLPLNFLGANVVAWGKSHIIHGHVGFSSRYSGDDIDISGDIIKSGNIIVYTTKYVQRFFEYPDVPGDGITELKLEVLDNQITSLKLIHPIFRIWKIDEYGTYLAFTGEHQTLCLKKANLVK